MAMIVRAAVPSLSRAPTSRISIACGGWFPPALRRPPVDESFSLVDGREYTVGPDGLVFGRDAGCDIVIPSSEVSRRHAEIVAGDNGYVLTDTSTNGLFVNGGRIEGMQILGRGDILRIGPEEFRFYADAVTTAAAPAAGAAAAPPAAVPPAPTRAPPPIAAAPSAAAPAPAPSTAPPPAAVVPPPIPATAPQPAAPPATAAAPAAPAPAPAASAPAPSAAPPVAPLSAPPSPAPPLASSEVRVAGGSAPSAPAGDAPPVVASAPAPVPAPSLASVPRGAIATLEVVGGGLLRGERYAVTMVLAHLGRGEHNDIVVPEESVSDSHAKLQRRDGIWYLTDLGSTNGTYVGGRRIEGEERLGPTADLRLGGVKLSFATSPTEPATEPRGSTRQFSGVSAAEFAPRAGASRSSAPGRSSRPEPREPALPARTAAGGTRGHRWLWLILLGAAVIAATLYFVQGR